jgi:Protein of unknown function (DUF1569).
MDINSKAGFLKNNYVQALQEIDPATAPAWGKMNVHQMIEHMSYSFRQASGKDNYTILTPAENLPRMQAFLMSEKEFKENTPNQLLPDVPPPPVHSSIAASLNELQAEINDFFAVFDGAQEKTITNPFFGELTYEMWVQLLHKHARHHLKQFGA